MSTERISDLNKSLKSAFSSVAKDINRLRKRDNVLKEQLQEMKKKLESSAQKDQVETVSRRIEEGLKDVAYKDDVKATETRIRSIVDEALSIPDGRAKNLEESIRSVEEEIDTVEAGLKKNIKALKQELSKSEKVKKELKELDQLKKKVSSMEEKYPSKKSVDEIRNEMDEIYQLVETLEQTNASKDDMQKFSSKVTSKLKKFEEKLKDIEDTEEELTRKTKDIYEMEKSLDETRKEMDSLSDSIKKIKNSKAVDDVKSSLSKEISKLDVRMTRQNESIRGINDKMNDIIKALNKEKEISIKQNIDKNLYEDAQEKLEKKRPGRPKKGSSRESASKPEKSKESPSGPSEDKKSLWKRMVDWLTEEVDEEE